MAPIFLIINAIFLTDYGHRNTHTYVEFPSHFTWVTGHCKTRQHGKDSTVGRVQPVHISTTERYYLRLLLYHVRGPISYEDVRTVNGVQHDSFEAAAEAMGLKHTNTHFLDALRDAVHDETNVMLLRKFFVTLLIMLRPTPQHVATAWDIFKNDLDGDYMLSNDLYPPTQKPMLLFTHSICMTKYCGKYQLP